MMPKAIRRRAARRFCFMAQQNNTAQGNAGQRGIFPLGLLTQPSEEDMMGEMNPLISLLEQRVNDARQRMELAKAELDDYERALTRERERQPSEEPQELTQKDKLVGFLRSMALQGSTYKELADFLTQSGIKVGKNFAYNTIARLKTEGKVEERGGKLFYKG
jgi:hypothetical protein